MRSMRVLVSTIIAVGAMVMTGCGGGVSTDAGEQVAATSSKPVTSTKQDHSGSKSDSSDHESGQAAKPPAGTKPVQHEELGKGDYPVQFWVEPLGVQAGEYLFKVHVTGIHSVEWFALYLASDKEAYLHPKVVDGDVQLKPISVPDNMLIDFKGWGSDSADFTLGYDPSLVKKKCFAVLKGWVKGEDGMSNPVWLCPVGVPSY